MFRRRSDTESSNAQTVAQAEPGVDSSESGTGREGTKPGPKGKPTPKRSEAEQARKERRKPPLNKREALRKDRERVKTQRAKAREAMASGDERYFLKRDQGPVRKFVRDYVDSRRTVGEYFLPIIVVVLFANFIPIAQLQLIMMAVWLVVMLLLFIDMTILGIRVRRAVRERFGDDEGRGHAFYAIMRAMQLRRLRLPKPAVKPGELV